AGLRQRERRHRKPGGAGAEGLQRIAAGDGLDAHGCLLVVWAVHKLMPQRPGAMMLFGSSACFSFLSTSRLTGPYVAATFSANAVCARYMPYASRADVCSSSS